MLDTRFLRLGALAAAAFIIIIFGNIVIVAQTIEGTWTARLDKQKEGKVHLSFSRSNGKSGKNTFGSDFQLNEINGLTAADITTDRKDFSFSIKREAGVIECFGSFTDQKGSGTYRFTADSRFADSVRNAGFETDVDDLFAATVLDITAATVRDVASFGFSSKDFDDVVKAKIFKITSDYAVQMRSAGFDDLEMEDLVKGKIFKIDPAFVNAVRAQGFNERSMEAMVKLSIFKVTPEFIDEVRSEGLTNLSIEELVKLRIFKIDGAYIRKARAENVTLTVENLVNRKIGVWGKH